MTRQYPWGDQKPEVKEETKTAQMPVCAQCKHSKQWHNIRRRDSVTGKCSVTFADGHICPCNDFIHHYGEVVTDGSSD